MSKKALIVTRVSGFVPQFEMNNVKILQEMGYEIHYAANYDVVVYGKDNRRLQNTGIIRHHIPFVRSPFSYDVLRCSKSLKRLMLTEQFDLIHCHMPMTGVVARHAAKEVYKMTGKKVPVLYTAHGFHFYKGAPLSNWMYYLVEKHYARYTDRLIVINQEDFERGKKFSLRGKLEYVPGVGIKPLPEKDVSFDMKKEYGIPEENRVVVSVGELTQRKNHQTMIKAMDWFRHAPLTYLICGMGPLEEELRKLVKDMYLEEKVIFAGYCENISDILRQADYFALPSKQEGLSVALMEAMQAGLPVVAMDIRGNRDLTEDGTGGFLLEEDLPESYVKALRYFLDNEEEAVRMGEWNRQKVKKFALEKVEEKMRGIYTEVLGMED